jgi:hypothetical protein
MGIRYFDQIHAAGICLTLATISGLSACNPEIPKSSFDNKGCLIPVGYEYVLIAQDAPFQPYQVKIEDSKISWNGAYVTDQELTKFGQELALKHLNAGDVTFQAFGVPCQKRTQVREALARSGLCKKGRCWEAHELLIEPSVHEQ